ncbi:MAG: cyclase family protein [Verrucomicrobia bacterium]|nr:cyclase family protein [Verrucomicrobiota bacterium]
MPTQLIDLTRVIPDDAVAVTGQDLYITPEKGRPYTAHLHNFHHGSMIGTYIDFPGHIQETDDGLDSSSWPLDRLFRVDTTVIHLDKPNRSGPVTADELFSACPRPVSGGGLIINALGTRAPNDIEYRSVYLDSSASAWIVEQGIHLLVSDIYESQTLHGVFGDFFEAGIATVCHPANLHLLTKPTVKLTALPACFAGVTQLPCRLVAEMEL